jgi:hypothetical protein
MSKPESADNFQHVSKESSAHHDVREHAAGRLRDEAHHALNSKHHDGSHHATKSEPTHLDMTNVFEQSATKAVQGTSKAVGQVVAGAWKASGDEANHLWNAMDSNAATHFYKHDLCGDDIVRGALTAPVAVGGAIGLGLVTGLIAAESAVPLLATGAFVASMSALAAAGDYGTWHKQ